MTSPLTLVSNISFHRRITLDTSHGPLTISYADIGCPTGPAVLYIPGMFASRYLGIPLHIIAERAGVRLLVIDRPGMGASPDVPVSQRISVWVDIVPRLLAHLAIPRVTLVSHSAGTIYLLNTWAKCRELMSPVVIFLAPWVDAAHSRVTAMQAAQYIPAPAFSFWNAIPKFVITQATPALGASAAAMRRMTMASGIGTNRSDEGGTFLDENWRRMERDYGVPREEAAAMWGVASRFMFAENTVGANGEALQCLRKGDGGDWGVCSDYASGMRALAGLEMGRAEGERVTVRTYFSETDAMVGSRGQQYFEQCWRAPEVEGVDFVCRTIEGTDHDAVAQSVEVWEEIFSLVR
ncbi:Alpha/Beta hydrolase protein [Aspergillus varians]